MNPQIFVKGGGGGVGGGTSKVLTMFFKHHQGAEGIYTSICKRNTYSK